MSDFSHFFCHPWPRRQIFNSQPLPNAVSQLPVSRPFHALKQIQFCLSAVRSTLSSIFNSARQPSVPRSQANPILPISRPDQFLKPSAPI